MAITINLLRPQHFALTEGEKKILDAMLMNAYRQGIAQGEQNMAAKVINHCNEIERRLAERRKADRRE